MKSTEKQYELYSTIEYIKNSKEYNKADIWNKDIWNKYERKKREKFKRPLKYIELLDKELSTKANI